jgi:hypothetical protein
VRSCDTSGHSIRGLANTSGTFGTDICRHKATFLQSGVARTRTVAPVAQRGFLHRVRCSE